MSVKERRCVTFEEPERNLGLSEPNLVFSELSNGSNFRSSLTTLCKNDSRSRSRGRDNPWSRFRARRTKSHDVLPGGDPSCGVGGLQDGINDEYCVGRLARAGSRNSVRNLVRLFETRSMNEGRRSLVVLLDGRPLDIIIQPKLYASELLDLVASHVNLKEKKYFGLGFLDDTNQFNWLQGEKRVLDHEFPRKTGLLTLHFAIKFYVDTIGLLRDSQTVELFYLNARQLLYKGQLQCDAETVFQLAALVLQATNGDYESDEKTKEELKSLPVIPTSTLKEHPSIDYCEERIISYYEKISGTSRGLAIVSYMAIVERLETYGIHYYDVKDKRDIPWLLGVSHKGIAVYDKADKGTPRKLFNWKNLENLYYRDKKFSIEVHSPKREESGSQVSVNCRSLKDTRINVHTWFASSQQLIKCIWSMAVVQHQFYLDRKQSLGQIPTTRSMSEIAANLSRSSISLPGSLGSDLSHSSSSSHSLISLSNSRYDLTVEQSDSLKAERDMYQALKAKRSALQDSLRKKTEELKLLCLQEAMSNELSKLELEVELQDQITAAAYRLAKDKNVTMYVRKQRKQSYTKAQTKLKDMRRKLDEMHKTLGIHSPDDHPTGRSLGGMYNGVHPVAKSDLDLSHIIIVHDRSTNRQDDSCGNSIHSGDFSVGSDVTVSKCASSGYCSASASSVSSASRWLVNDDVSSFCGSISLSTVKSCNHIASEEDFSLDGDSTSNTFSSAIDEEQSFTLTRSGRKKHFIISRGPHSSRVQELDDGFSISKSSTRARSESRAKSHLATSESDLDMDSTLDDSFMENNSFYGCDDDLREEEEKVCTRVERRRQTFIASRRLMKVINSEMKHTGFEKGWETFQHILMGEDFEHKTEDFHENQTNKSVQLEDLNHKQTNKPVQLEDLNHKQTNKPVQLEDLNHKQTNKPVQLEDLNHKQTNKPVQLEDLNHKQTNKPVQLEDLNHKQTNKPVQLEDLNHKQTNKPVQLEDLNLRHEGPHKVSKDNEVELQRKIQELIDSEEVEKPFVRSRSFDYSHDSRVSKPNINLVKSKDDSRIGNAKTGINRNKDNIGISGAKSVFMNKNKDGLKSAKTQPKAKDSTTHIKNPFNFLTRRHNKPQQRQSESETQPPALHGCTGSVAAPNLSVGTSRTSSAQPLGMNKNHVDDSKRHAHSSKDSNKLDAPVSSSDIKSASSVTSKAPTRHTNTRWHCPRSASEPSAVNSKRGLTTENRHGSKVGAQKDSCSQKHDSASASSSKDISSRGSCDHGVQQPSRRRLSWNSKNKPFSLTTKGTETTV